MHLEQGGTGGGSRRWALYLGLALTTCSMLLVQQFLTRIYSIQFNAGLAFLAISITFLGLGSAGMAVYAFPRAFAVERVPRLVPLLALLYGLCLVGGFVALVATERAVTGEGRESLQAQVLGVLGASLWMLPAMFLVGLVIALVLRANAAHVHRLYGADLAGGGIGCLLVLPLMNQVGGDDGIFAIGALACAGAIFLAHSSGARGLRGLGLALFALCLTGPWLNRGRALVDVRSHGTGVPGISDSLDEQHELARIWNPLSRLGIFELKDGSSLYVRIDSGCQTGIPSLDPKFEAGIVRSSTFERLPFILERHRRYLEIGAGGGRQMVLAKALGAERVVGVEINPGIVAATMSGFPGFGVGPRMAADPDFRLVEDEGRRWTRASDERFDAVTITFIQTGVTSGSAAFALSEANLFTVEAFGEFLERLDDDGLFYVYRHSGNEMLRLISMARAALGRLGITDITRHLYAAINTENRTILLIARSPLSDEEVARLDRACDELRLKILYSPSGAPGPRPPNPYLQRLAELRANGTLTMDAVAKLYQTVRNPLEFETLETAYVRSPDPQAFQERYLVDVSAPTDDRPYYFFTGLASWKDFGLYFDTDGVQILGGTVILLFWMAVVFSVLVALLILAPLAWKSGGLGNRRRGLAVLCYFSGLGVGYIAVQISFIQRFTLFLGHPVYAISVVLLAFLLSSGLGSMASSKLFDSGRLSFGRTLLLLAGVLLLYNQCLPALFHSDAIAWPVAAKIVLTILLVLPLAFLMGLLFPQGIRLVERAAPELVPWAWGANSAASILGSIFSLIFAIHLGFTATAVAAGVAYLVLCWPASRVLRQ
ncbi:MAG: hypothetical protein EXS08_16590 [Planctomycetes bacterium]|nr:hypothetical protein [Planctomycetota bacterium]